MLLIRNDAFAARQTLAHAQLAPLADSLSAALAPLLHRDVYVPTEKALLSREGGRCPHDNTLLAFDPFAPHEHRCPDCGASHTSDLHHRAWIYPYQLWLAERAVHAATLFALRGDAAHASLARAILRRYADVYATYPNRDNVLGPTRLFFSTYLESIWLLQICIATDTLAFTGDTATAAHIRDAIIAPSARIIGEYDEGMSNRQVWNNAALMAAALARGDRDTAERIVHAPSGIEAHLRHGLLRDGTWYEGENYHLFAHRGLWYGVTMADCAGIPIDATLLARFREGFATPFATALPDLTLPSRKDSQYAISLRQPRFAELCELGLARGDDPRLVHALSRLYATDIARGDTGRSRSTADVERNLPATSLTRADLGWRSLLYARGALPALDAVSAKSAHLDGQGMTVFRRDAGRIYVALDWGQHGGGHGHPDRLNLLFAIDGTRVLDDLGTGSYVDPSLHWYRSTLAHNAPLVNGASQQPVSGRVRALDERGGVGWILADVDGIANGVHVERALIVTPDYFVDEITWRADQSVRFELPIHADGTVDGLAWHERPLDGGAGLEDGFAFARDARAAGVTAREPVRFSGPGTARAWMCGEQDAQLFHASAPGQPASSPRTFYVMRCEGTTGVARTVWAWSDRVDAVSFANNQVTVILGTETHVHARTDEYWQVEMTAGSAKSGIELYGWQDMSASDTGPSAIQESRNTAQIAMARNGPPIVYTLGADHYLRSEQAWNDAGRPTATVLLSTSATELANELTIDVRVVTAQPVFVPADAVNAYDNEHPDINGHGVQLYVRVGDIRGGWMLVPDGADVRIRNIDGWHGLAAPHADWTRTAEGFAIRAHVPLPHDTPGIALDVIVNDAVSGRARRRGQLVLSGARGEFVYLRGDRHDARQLMAVQLKDSMNPTMQTSVSEP